MGISSDEMLSLHRELDDRSRAPGRSRFISGWQTFHPYSGDYLNISRELARSAPRSDQYSFISDSARLVEAIRRFHAHTDQVDYPPEAVFATCGSSPLLTSFFFALRELGVADVCYVPPIYYACHYQCRSLGIDIQQVADGPLHDASVAMALPDRRTALVLCDPIWVFGTTVHRTHLETIRDWQLATGSVVLVDGTFQYTKWDMGDRIELTSVLAPELTFRIVCPTKSLAVHGVRFAYMLLPPALRESVRYACSNITGATGVANERFALRLMEVLNSPVSNQDLVRYIKKTHDFLGENKVILAQPYAPVASYYTFAELNETAVENALVMDERFFGISGYGSNVRVNLLHEGWTP